MNRRSGGIFDAITVIFLVLSLVVFLIALGMIGHVVPVPAALRPASPTQIATIVIPTDTITPVPTVTDTPTRTETPTRTPSPLPPTNKPTETATITQTASDTPLVTATDSPTDTPTTVPDTNTPTKAPPTVTRVPTRTRTATKTKAAANAAATKVVVAATKTPPGFPFALGPGSPSLTSNLDTTTGCAFQGMGGQVFGLNSEALTGLQVNVTGPNGFNQSASTGSNPRYGQSGWEVRVDTKVSNNTYTIELRSTAGIPLSDKVTVAFPNSCQSNLALLNFVETRPY